MNTKIDVLAVRLSRQARHKPAKYLQAALSLGALSLGACALPSTAHAQETAPPVTAPVAAPAEATPAEAPVAPAAVPASDTPAPDAAPVAPAAPAEAPDEKAVPVEDAGRGDDKRILLAQTDVAPPGPVPGGQSGSASGNGAMVPGGPTTAGAAANAAPSLPVLLGFADLLISIDRPYEAEKIYRGILANAPKIDPAAPPPGMPPEAVQGILGARAAAEAGLREVALAKRTTYTVLGHYYDDSHDVELYTYGGGPTFRTRYGRFTLTSGTGHYRNNNDPNNTRNPLTLLPTIPTAADNDTLKKNTLNALFEGYRGKYETNVFLSNVTYDRAPDRFLYNFQVSYLPQAARKRFSLSYGRHDSYFQNVNAQFFAPESYFQLVKGITYNDASVALEYPLGNRIDFTASYRHFNYTDGNQRANYRTQLLYRVLGTEKKPLPTLRVGLDAILDDSKFFTLDYSASTHFNVVSLAADYVRLSKRLKYGAYASVPVARQNFDPPATFFGFASYKVSRDFELYAKAGRLSAPGISLTFRDYVVGVNTSF